MPLRPRSTRYVGWLQRRATAILIASAALVLGAAYLAAFHLPLEADFANLLPADAPAVRDAERLAQRVPARDTMLVLVTAPAPADRAAAAAQVIAGLREVPRDLVERIETDEDDVRAFVRAHRHLFTPVADLEAARAALAQQIEAAKLRANPLYIDLEDAPPAPAAAGLDELRARQRAGEARLSRPSHVSADGTVQVIVVRTAFRATDVDRDRALLGRIDAIVGGVRAAHPAVRIGLAGGPPVTIAEHRALGRGIAWSTAITCVLVALVLFIHLRSLRVLALLVVNVTAGTLAAFGVAALAIGHLNAATAFLGAIIAGNGINYGILLVARFLEERRGAPAPAALAEAIAGTLVPTLVASLGAAIAYGALAATQFRGFADFAVIGGAGMLACWIASFVLLPVLVLRFAHTPRRAPSRLFGGFVVRVFGLRRPVLACAVAGAVTLVAGGVAWRFISGDPYEYDLTRLRSQAPDAQEARGWLALSDQHFGRGLAGLAGQTYIAVDRPEQVPAVVAALGKLAAREPIVGPVQSILDVVPADQPAKLRLLAELRGMIDEAAGTLDGQARAELLSLRPPDELAAITARDLPPGIAARLAERDGRIGNLIAVRPGDTFDERDGHDLIAFAGAVRRLELPGGEAVTTAGATVLFADILTQIQTDGPLVTGIAAVALVGMVLLVVGRTRRAAAVLAATFAGSVAMVAVCALVGLKITFLDFISLPITLGLGIDYAINVADRAAHADPLVALRSTGGTVLVCSLTTIIGYLSLLVSDNAAIHGFGLASLIGEITCVVAALVIVPAIIALPRLARRPARARAYAPAEAAEAV